MTQRWKCSWLHGWSVLTVLATLVLLGLGSAVTNFKAGMADEVWPTSPVALFQSSPEQLADVRWVIEHSHRLAGYVVGCLAIGLAVWLWTARPTPWLPWLGTAALVGVCIQGVIGGLRVTEHVRWGLELRIVHGAFAQVVLGLLVAASVTTSSTWIALPALAPEEANARRGARVVLGLVYGQIVLGVLLRHTYHPVAQRLHLLMAFAATAGVVWLARQLWREGSEQRMLRVVGIVLKFGLLFQLVLGVEAWMTQLGSGVIPEMLPVTMGRVVIRSAHVLGGSFLFGTTLVATLLVGRAAGADVGIAGSTSRLEGAA